MSSSTTQPVITPSHNDEKTTRVRVGTRKSALALKQADFVVGALSKLHPDVHFEIVGMHSTADKDKITALYNFGGKGLWTNELEAGLMANELDVILHCVKDMPTGLPEGCVLACVTEREDPRDVVVVKKGLEHKYKKLADLPDGSIVGTSSVRRMAQIRRKYPKLEFKDMRGNLDTRLRKLDAEDSEYSVLILAAAGLVRMGLLDRVAQYLDSSTNGGGMLYAVGQGGLGLEARTGDTKVTDLLMGLENKTARLEAEAERSVMRTLEGGCSVPIGVESKWTSEHRLKMLATVVSVDGQQHADGELEEDIETSEQAIEFGKRLAQQLRDNGAQPILDVIITDRKENPSDEKWVPA